MRLIELEGIEKDIVLAMCDKKDHSVKSLSEGLGRNKSSISVAVERLAEKDLIKDKEVISPKRSSFRLKRDRVKVERVSARYKIYFIICFSSLMASLPITFFTKQPLFLAGCTLGLIPIAARLVMETHYVEDHWQVFAHTEEGKPSEKEE